MVEHVQGGVDSEMGVSEHHRERRRHCEGRGPRIPCRRSWGGRRLRRQLPLVTRKRAPGCLVGDFLYSEHHTYMMDGSVLRWIANLKRFEDRLGKYNMLYVGHGSPSDASLLQSQQQYFETACRALLDATRGSAVLNDDSRKQYEKTMLAAYPGYGFKLTVSFSADALAKELVGVKNYDW